MTGKLKEGKNVCILSSLITDKLSFVFILLVSMILFLFLCWQCYIGAKTTEHMSTIESRLLEELVDNVEDSSKTDKNLLYCKESLHAELRLIKARFEDFSSSITLILSVVTIVFVIFSFLGLMKIQDELKHLEKDKEEFERKMEDKLKGMDDERERHKREMSDNLQEMQEIQDKTRVESLLSQFRYKEADMICRKYEGMGYPYFIYASARVEMDRENYKGARERLENVIHLFYKDVQNEYYYYLGETYFYLEEFELAGRYVLKAMEVLQSKSSLPGLDSSKKDLRIIDETCTSSQYTLSRYSCLLGRIYLSTIQGDSLENNNTFEKALSAFAEALRWDKRNTDILMWIAITYRKRGEYSRSIELLKNIIAINPEMWYYYHELAVSYYRKGLSHKGTGDISLSHECYRQAEDSYCILFDKMRVYHLADDYGYHYHLGVIYIEWEKYPEAIRELNYSIENNDNAKVYYFYDLGRAYYGAGQYESSSEYFKLACEKSEEKESLYLFYLALSYVYQLEKGNDAISWGETARLLEKAIFIDGYKEFYYTHLVVVYLASDRMAKAGEYMERYNRLTERKDRNHYRFLQLLLNVLYYSPDIKECRECFVRSNENNQNSMNGLVNFARHSLQAGLKSGSLHGDELKNRILELLA